jgi:hypothetical protein
MAPLTTYADVVSSPTDAETFRKIVIINLLRAVDAVAAEPDRARKIIEGVLEMYGVPRPMMVVDIRADHPVLNGGSYGRGETYGLTGPTKPRV